MNLNYISKIVGKHEGCVFALAFSPDERLIVSGSEDQTVRVWNIESQNEVRRFHHEGWVNSVAFSPDGTHVVSGSDDKSFRLWNIQTNRCVIKQSLLTICYFVGFFQLWVLFSLYWRKLS